MAPTENARTIGKSKATKAEKSARTDKLDKQRLSKTKNLPGKQFIDRKKNAKKNRKSMAGGEYNSTEDEFETTSGRKTSVPRNRTKKSIKVNHQSKVPAGAEEVVLNAASDFWESAWSICAERFYNTAAPIIVSVDLRNTWLRIVEAEWLDSKISEKSTDPDLIFDNRDQAPLPLAFDSWARGATETLPRNRRESVMDPFLRDFDEFGNLQHASKKVETAPVETSQEEEENDEEDTFSKERTEETETGTGTSADYQESKFQIAKGKKSETNPPPSRNHSSWQLELDKEYKNNFAHQSKTGVSQIPSKFTFAAASKIETRSRQSKL